MKVEIGKTYWTVHKTFVKVLGTPFDGCYEGEIVAGFGAGTRHSAHRDALLEEAVVWPDGKLQRATSMTARDIYAWGMCVSDGQGDVLANALFDTLSEPQMQRLEREFDAWLGEPLHSLSAEEVERRALQFRDAAPVAVPLIPKPPNSEPTKADLVHGHMPPMAHRLAEVMHAVRTGNFDALGEPEPKPDPPTFNGWTHGDVMTYLERFGEAWELNIPGWYSVSKGPLFHVDVDFDVDDSTWCVKLEDSEGNTLESRDAPVLWRSTSLPEAMQKVVEGWRHLVTLSDPEPAVDAGPSQCPHGNHTGSPCPLCMNMRHIGTGDMGQRNMLGGGWGGRDD